jgi:hypothetical protein
MAQLNDRHTLRRLGVTRRRLLEEVDGPPLKALPGEPYEYSEWRGCRVGVDYPQWTDAQYFRSIVVVALKDHSRRLRRVLGRTMKGHPTHVIIQAARYSDFDPDRWWETHGGVRTELVELQKLLLDVVLHPFVQ